MPTPQYSSVTPHLAAETKKNSKNQPAAGNNNKCATCWLLCEIAYHPCTEQQPEIQMVPPLCSPHICAEASATIAATTTHMPAQRNSTDPRWLGRRRRRPDAAAAAAARTPPAAAAAQSIAVRMAQRHGTGCRWGRGRQEMEVDAELVWTRGISPLLGFGGEFCLDQVKSLE